MGRYSNVNASLLLSTTTRAIDEIASNDFGSVTQEITNQAVLKSSATPIIRNALNDIRNNKLINGSLANLKDKLKNLKEAANYIIKVQSLEKEIEKLERDLRGATGVQASIIQTTINVKTNTMREYEAKIDNFLR